MREKELVTNRNDDDKNKSRTQARSAMDFQVVVLAGGDSKNLAPLVSKEVLKPLLPVANRPVLSYVLELLEASNLKDLIVVVEGADAAIRVGGWISSAYEDRLHVEVAGVPEDVGTAGALRAVAHHLTTNDVLIVSGDLVSDVPPGAVAATHRRHGAAVTALLCNTPVSGSPEPGSSGGKDKVKKPARHNIVGFDPTRQFLLHVAAGAEIEKDIRVQKRIVQAVGQMEIRADLMDAHMYAFKRTILQEVLHQKDTFHSIRHDVLPYLVRTQLRSEVLTNKGEHNEESWNVTLSSQDNLAWLSRDKEIASSAFQENVLVPNVAHNGEAWNNTLSSQDSLIWLSQHREIAPSAFQENILVPNGTTSVQRTHKCCAYIANKSKYCARLNSIQAFSDINRDVVGEASHLSGYSFSAQNNIVHPSAELGSKTTVGPQCMLAEGSKLGDKCSVKRSVIGRHCRIGSNVKIVNSVVMDHVTMEDGCLIQGSVICSNVQLQERVVLKDCQVGAGYLVTSGSEHKSESLARK